MKKPLTPKQRATLQAFALEVLATLERDKDWGADTLESIMDASTRRGLNTLDRDLAFRVAPGYRGRV
jgi:hypothetical protein